MIEPHSILLICTANQCRSPMAEALLKRDLFEKYPKTAWEVESAGTWAEPGHPATPFGVKAMAEFGLDTSNHKSRVVTSELVSRFQLILTMENGHKEAIQIEFPDLAERVFLLSKMSGENVEVADPVGGSFLDYQNTAKEIEKWIERGLPKIVELSG